MGFISVKHGYFCLFILVVNGVIAQNIIGNPSFEEQLNCPTDLGNFEDDVLHWSAPTNGSTDYFNGCSRTMGTPKNFNGAQPADFGIGYSGFYLYAPDDYREYIQAELTQPLTKGEKYRLSFYISLAEQSEFAIREFGVLFSNNKLKYDTRKVLSKMHLFKNKLNEYHSFEIAYPKFFSNTEDWVLIQKEFKAKGTEHFLTIGNFKNNKRTRLHGTKKKGKKAAYYYIDMVLLESAEASSFSKKALSAVGGELKPPLQLDKRYVFEHVFFEFDKSELLEKSKEEIKNIYGQLSANKELMISIEGHTDSIGSETYNLILSNQRAQKVKNYLIDLGISTDRITSFGYGGTKPLASNASEQGRKQNRRVEFLLSKIE